MPTKNNIELGNGTLYITRPEGGDPVPLATGGLVPTVEITPTDTHDDPVLTSLRTAQELTFEVELETLNLPTLWLLSRDPAIIAKWAKIEHPRLARLVIFAKTGRRRDKNLRRLVRLFLEEAFA